MELELEERLSASLPIAALLDLCEHWSCGPEPQMSPPLSLGWDIRRQWPNDQGFAVWRDLMHAYEPPLLAKDLMQGDLRQAVTIDQYEAALVDQWARLDRPKHWLDHLIVDVMADEQARGYEPAGDAWERTESILNDLAARVGAKRAAFQAEQDARADRYKKRLDRFFELDDAGYAKWLADDQPDGNGLKFERWEKRRFNEILDKAEMSNVHPIKPDLPPPPSLKEYPTSERNKARIAGLARLYEGGWRPFPKGERNAALLEDVTRTERKFPLNIEPNQLDIWLTLFEEHKPKPDVIKTGSEFLAEFTPPDYLLDGVFQRGFCYAVTGKTGTGKTAVIMRFSGHVDTGKPMCGRQVEKGQVLYLAGENPTDVQMRWLGLTQEMGIDPAASNVHFISGVVPLEQTANAISAEIERKGLKLALVVVDTAAAYFPGDDDNNNVQMGNYARLLRSLTTLPGKPVVLILAHPTKNAADDNLVPKGGGNFLNEIDGNVALRRVDGAIAFEALGKFRGPEFNPVHFELRVVKHPRLKDTRGRDIPTVVAFPLDDAGVAAKGTANVRDEDKVLKAIGEHPNKGREGLAKLTGMYDNKVDKIAKNLADQKLIAKERVGWSVTSKGARAITALESAALGQGNALPEIPRSFFPGKQGNG
jgi:hypothetical protein